MGKLGLFKKELELTRSDDIVYGKYDDYIVTFTENEKEVELFVDTRLGSVDSDTIAELKKFVQASSVGYKLISFSMSATGASVVVNKKNASSLLEFCFLFISQLKTLGIPGDNVCSNCGRQITHSSLVRIANHAHSCDPECVQKLIAGSAGKQRKRTVQKGSFLGFIGALLGVILAVSGYVYLGMNSYFCAAAAMLFPIFASVGYTLFGGKPCAAKGITVIMLPILFFAAAAFGILCYSVYAQWISLGYVFSVSELTVQVAKSIATPKLIQEFVYEQVLIGGIFILIGYIFSLPQAFAKKQPPRISVLD
ncbi:MAG: hypothetical protein RSA97_03785 [Oscillospiraceae bacterium]